MRPRNKHDLTWNLAYKSITSGNKTRSGNYAQGQRRFWGGWQTEGVRSAPEGPAEVLNLRHHHDITILQTQPHILSGLRGTSWKEFDGSPHLIIPPLVPVTVEVNMITLIKQCWRYSVPPSRCYGSWTPLPWRWVTAPTLCSMKMRLVWCAAFVQRWMVSWGHQRKSATGSAPPSPPRTSLCVIRLGSRLHVAHITSPAAPL